MKNYSKIIVIGSLLYAVIASARPLYMGLELPVVLTQFFLQDFALYAAVALVVSAIGLEKYRYVIATAILVPIFSIIPPVYMNIKHFEIGEYLKSWDFHVALGIAAFAFIGVIVSSLSVVSLLNRQRNAKA